jgi:RNA methyltransferase, TrmH family
MIEKITSLSNNRIKKVVKLSRDGKFRQLEKLIVVDGQREIEEALRFNWEIEEFYFCPKLIKNVKEAKEIISSSKNSYETDKKVFEKISYKKNPDGYLAVLKYRKLVFSDFILKENPLILVLESVEKPGNLGAVVRTAYASGVDLIILNDQKTDLYSPNVIRASTGFIFSMPLVLSSIEGTIKYLKKEKVDIITTSIKASKNHFEADYNDSVAIVFGSEAFGLSNKWLNIDVDKIKIPMLADVDSLNISVSVGIIVYEAIRQRKFSN